MSTNEQAPKSVPMIAREIGDKATIINGRDYKEPSVRVVPNTHKDAVDGEKALYIQQRDGGVSLTVETLQAILNWAAGKNGE